jgi:hypothetical protein
MQRAVASHNEQPQTALYWECPLYFYEKILALYRPTHHTVQ